MNTKRTNHFHQDAIQAWNDYQANGLHVSQADADAWLAELESGQDVTPPLPQTTGSSPVVTE
jgi:predicted transcriptional regulator